MFLEDKMIEAQEKIEEVEILFRNLLFEKTLDPDQTEDVERILQMLKRLQIECMGIS